MKEMNEKPKKTITKRNLPLEVKVCVKACQAKKAEDIVVIHLGEISSFTDFFIVMQGNSNKQNLAIYENVEQEMKKRKIRPLSVEGRRNAEWILMDYGSIILHIFSPTAREFYSLEKLWADGEKLTYS